MADNIEKQLFNDALELSGDQRREFLKKECGGDQGLFGRVIRLLEAFEGADDILKETQTRQEATEHEGGAEKSGSVIGPYTLLEKIGEGGFGVVYMAEQKKPVRRRVALKIIKPGMDTKQLVARLEVERQALAMMNHPAIAKVFDGGVTKIGRPFFVMELIHGTSIIQFCDEHNLTTRDRLELFVQVCQAVQHAHQKGIIHRDLKPNNILVTDTDGMLVPKIIDFGIAKATQADLTDKTLFTQFRQFIGTPAYMSPEQAKQSCGDVDTRSDIYSLGVLLYELVTGRTPFNPEEFVKAGLDEMRHLIQTKEPLKPSNQISRLSAIERTELAKRRCVEPAKLSRMVSGDLDWIVLKALEKDRNRRYESSAAFATDVQNLLEDKPVNAMPPSSWYRAQKFAKRHRGPLIAAALVVSAFTFGLITSSIQAKRARRAEARLAILLDQETKMREAAESARLVETELREQSDELKDQAIRESSLVSDLLSRSLFEQAKSKRLLGQPGRRIEALELLDESASLAMRDRPENLSRHEQTPDEAAIRSEVIASLLLADSEIEWSNQVIRRRDTQWNKAQMLSADSRFLVELDFGNGRNDADSNETEFKRLRLFDLWEQREVVDRDGSGFEGKTMLALSPGGEWLAVGQELRIDLFNVWEGKVERSIDLPVGYRIGIPVPLWRESRFSPSGRYLMIGFSTEDHLIWDTRSGESWQRCRFDYLTFGASGGNRLSRDFAFSSDETMIAKSNGRRVMIYDLGLGKRTAFKRFDDPMKLPVVFGPSDELIMTFEGERNGDRVEVWDAELEEKRLEYTLRIRQGRVAPCVSHDRTKIAFMGYQTIAVHRHEDGRELLLADDRRGSTRQWAAWDANDRGFHMGGFGEWRKWRFEYAAPFRKSIVPGYRFHNTAISSDGRWIALAEDIGDEANIGIFDTETGEVVSRFVTPPKGTNIMPNFAFSYDNRELMFSDDLEIAMSWDVRTERFVESYRNPGPESEVGETFVMGCAKHPRHGMMVLRRTIDPFEEGGVASGFQVILTQANSGIDFWSSEIETGGAHLVAKLSAGARCIVLYHRESQVMTLVDLEQRDQEGRFLQRTIEHDMPIGGVQLIDAIGGSFLQTNDRVAKAKFVLWSAKDGQVIESIEGGHDGGGIAGGFRLSGNGRYALRIDTGQKSVDYYDMRQQLNLFTFPDSHHRFGLSHSGEKVVVADGVTAHVWDLPAIRSELSQLSLEW